MINRIRQAVSYLARHLSTTPWPTLTLMVGAVMVSMATLGWPNVIY